MARGFERPPIWATALIVISIVGLAVGLPIALSRTAPPGSADASSVASTAAAAPTSAEPAPVTVSPGDQVLIFGDSWTEGYSADDPTVNGYAYLTGAQAGWETTVDGVAGTGYLNPGPNGEGTFGQRIAALTEPSDPTLIILQGGINDAYQDLSQLPTAARDVLTALRERFPDAQVVMFGPGTTALPVPDAITQTDRLLQSAASSAGVDYISPLGEGWFTDENIDQVIDAETQHPSTDGHAMLAARLGADLDSLRS